MLDTLNTRILSLFQNKKVFLLFFFVLHLTPALYFGFSGKVMMVINDDTAIIAMLKLGDHQTLTLSPLISLFLAKLYAWFGDFPIYSIYLTVLVLGFVGMSYLILMEMLKKIESRYGGLFILAFLFFSVALTNYNVLYLGTTNTTAFYLALALCLNMMTSFKFWLFAVAVVFMRFDILVFTPVIFAPIFASLIWVNGFNKKLIFRFGCLIASLLIFLVLGRLSYSEEYKHWLKFNHSRAYFQHFDFLPKKNSPVARGEVSELKMKSIRYDWWHFDDEIAPGDKIIASSEPYYKGLLDYLNPFFGRDKKRSLWSQLTTQTPYKFWTWLWFSTVLFAILVPKRLLVGKYLFLLSTLLAGYFLFTFLCVRNVLYMTPGLIAILAMLSFGYLGLHLNRRFVIWLGTILLTVGGYQTVYNWNLSVKRDDLVIKHKQVINDFKSLRKLEPTGLWLPAIYFPLDLYDELLYMHIFKEDHPSLYSQKNGLTPAGWMVRHPFTQNLICSKLYNKKRCQIKTIDFLSNPRVFFFGKLPLKNEERFFLTYLKQQYNCDYKYRIVHQIEERSGLAKIDFICP